MHTTIPFKVLMSVAASAALGGIAHAAGTLVVDLVPRQASISLGGSVIVDIFADYSGVTGSAGQAPLGVGGFKFDVTGNANGSLAGDVNDVDFEIGLSDGVPSGSDLLGISAGQIPFGLDPGYTGGYLGSVIYTDAGTAAAAYSVTISIVNYVSPGGDLNVYTSLLGNQSRPSYTSDTGNFHLVTFNSQPFHVVPTPGAFALLAVGAAGFHRRR